MKCNFFQFSSTDFISNWLTDFIYQSDEDDEIHALYWANEKKCRKYTIRIGTFVLFHSSTFVIAFVRAAYFMIIENYDTSTWNSSIFMNIPIDKSHPMGWLINNFIQFAMALSYALAMSSITSYFASGCLYIVTMCKHFILYIKRVNADVEPNELEENPRKIAKNRLKITKQLCNAIEIHHKIFEYVDNFNFLP